MKQHITTDQFKELSKNGKDKLREWWNDKRAEGVFDITEEGVVPLLSIGQMIEFLREYRRLWTIEEEYVRGEDEDGRIIDHHEWKVYRKHASKPFYASDELCDALWEAVKEVLEHEK